MGRAHGGGLDGPVRVIKFHGVDAAKALLAAYARPDVREMQNLAWELPRPNPTA